MPRKAHRAHCPEHNKREGFRMGCSVCGRNDTCPYAPAPGRPYPSMWAELCETTRARLRKIGASHNLRARS